MKKFFSSIIGVPAAAIALLVCLLLYIWYIIALAVQNIREFLEQFFTGRSKAPRPKK